MSEMAASIWSPNAMAGRPARTSPAAGTNITDFGRAPTSARAGEVSGRLPLGARPRPTDSELGESKGTHDMTPSLFLCGGGVRGVESGPPGGGSPCGQLIL